MQGETKMKAGDKVLHIDSIQYCAIISLFEIDKFSKDGKKARNVHGKICNYPDDFLVSAREPLIRKIKDIVETDKNLLLYRVSSGTYKVFRCGVYEDEFDDVFHICGMGYEWIIAKKYGFFAINQTTYFSQDVESIADFIIRDLGIFNNQLTLEKLNEWEEKFGFGKSLEIWTDYLGGTTQIEYAIENNIDPTDYDRWQRVQKLLKHELKYETARGIFNTLYEKEDIEILECE